MAKKVYGLPSYTVMVATFMVTMGIIGTGWAMIPSILFGDSILPYAVSLWITGEVFWAYYCGLRVGSFSKAKEGGEGGCEKCGAERKEGTHHCSICERCVDGMDHHCLFLNTCVGDRNQSHFIKYVAWVSLATGYVFALTTTSIIQVGVPMQDYNVSQAMAFIMAFPVALAPALYPVIGLKKVLYLSTALTAQITTVGLIFLDSIPDVCYPIVLTAGLKLFSDTRTLYLGVSIGAPVFLAFTMVVLFTTTHTRALLVLAASSLSVMLLTGYLLASHLMRLWQGITTLEEIKNLKPPADRLRGWENIKRAMGVDGVVGAVWRLMV